MSDFRPCRDCRDWNMCLLTQSEKHWFGYEHIRFCKHHVFFLLKYEDVIRGRAWPTSDEALGGASTQVLRDAAWVKVSVVLAEVGDRLDKTGWKGKLLSDQCKNRDRIDYLTDDAKDALYYVAGKRKVTPLSTLLAVRRYDQKTYRKYKKPEKCQS